MMPKSISISPSYYLTVLSYDYENLMLWKLDAHDKKEPDWKIKLYTNVYLVFV